MERILYNHFSDPEKIIIDITGISMPEFRIIVSALKHFRQSWETLLSITPEQRKEFYKNSLDIGVLDGVEHRSQQEFENFLIESEDRIIEEYNRAYEILVQINKPYPGD